MLGAHHAGLFPLTFVSYTRFCCKVTIELYRYFRYNVWNKSNIQKIEVRLDGIFVILALCYLSSEVLFLLLAYLEHSFCCMKPRDTPSDTHSTSRDLKADLSQPYQVSHSSDEHLASHFKSCPYIYVHRNNLGAGL